MVKKNTLSILETIKKKLNKIDDKSESVNFESDGEFEYAEGSNEVEEKIDDNSNQNLDNLEESLDDEMKFDDDLDFAENQEMSEKAVDNLSNKSTYDNQDLHKNEDDDLENNDKFVDEIDELELEYSEAKEVPLKNIQTERIEISDSENKEIKFDDFDENDLKEDKTQEKDFSKTISSDFDDLDFEIGDHEVFESKDIDENYKIDNSQKDVGSNKVIENDFDIDFDEERESDSDEKELSKYSLEGEEITDLELNSEDKTIKDNELNIEDDEDDVKKNEYENKIKSSIDKLVSTKNITNKIDDVLSDNSEEILDKALELLEPKLYEWLDKNLVGIVEEVVRQEIRHIASKK